MRSVRILAMGALGLAAALLFPLIQNYVLMTLALAPLALLVIGQFYLPRSRHSIQVWFNRNIVDDEGERISLDRGTPFLRLSGKNLPYSSFKQWHEFEVVTHRFWLLLTIGFTSLFMVWLVWYTRESFLSGAAFFYLIGSIWMLLVTLAIRWGSERRMLRREGIAMAGFSVENNSKPPYRRIRYHFVDRDGHHWGGIFDSMFCDEEDDMTLVFYDEANPDRSVPASALIFHKLVWKDPTAAAANV